VSGGQLWLQEKYLKRGSLSEGTVAFQLNSRAELVPSPFSTMGSGKSDKLELFGGKSVKR
jgi:hypothetical protein